MIKVEFDIDEFNTEIDRMMEINGGDYIEAICEFCSQKDIEIEFIAGIIKKNPVHKEKLLISGLAKRLLKQ